jgi:hypothetical protein
MNKKKIEKRKISFFFTNYRKEISELKEKILSDFKEYMTLKFGMVFIAEWLDFRMSSIYTDKFLIVYENKLYKIHFPSQGSIMINERSFRRYDTIDMKKVSGGLDEYGYKIETGGRINNTNDKNKHPKMYYSDFEYVYRDFLRKEKIKKFLEDK